MTITITTAIIVGILWLRTGRDPLYWLIKALIAFRAVLATVFRISLESIHVFREYFPESFAQGKKEVGA